MAAPESRRKLVVVGVAAAAAVAGAGCGPRSLLLAVIPRMPCGR
jgi:hypothetical protein